MKSRIGLRWCLTGGVPLIRREQLRVGFGMAMKQVRPLSRGNHRLTHKERQLEAVAASRLQRLAEAVPVDLAEL